MTRFRNANIDPFLELYRPNYMYCDSVNLRSETCVKHFTDFVDNLRVTDDISQTLKCLNRERGQNVNANWVNARNNLITASVMGEVYKR